MNAIYKYKVISYNPRCGVCFNDDDDRHEYLYRWYWQAKLRSWIDYHLFSMNCNTYIKNSANVKPIPVVWK